MSGLYLHYLDRELRLSVSWRPHEDTICCITTTLAICTVEPLYCGLSLICETCYPNDRLRRLIWLLLKYGHLQAATQYRTLPEFLESRKDLYAHDKERYPMYFSPQHTKSLCDLDIPLILKQQDTTQYLLTRLNVAVQDERYPIILPDPLDRNLRHIFKDILLRGIENLGGKAVTVSAFTPFLQEQSFRITGSLRRLISEEYTRHYCSIVDADIPTGIPGVEHYDFLSQNFPIYDYTLLNLLCGNVLQNFGSIIHDERAYKTLVQLKGSENQRQFVKETQVLLQTLMYIRHGSGRPHNMHIIRQELKDNINTLPWGKPVVLPTAGEDPFAQMLLVLMRCCEEKASSDPFWGGCYRMAREHQMKQETRILLCTATDVEDDALLEAMQLKGVRGSIHTAKRGRYILFRMGRKLTIVCVRSRMGSLGASGSELSIIDAIEDVNPEYVISCGIAFGASPDRQSIGDVLISEWVRMYEKARVGKKVVPRGDRMPASPMLLQVASITRIQLPDLVVRTGGLLSGEKLVDDPEFKKALWEIEPEAIGGEMEGAGIASACYRRNIPWIVVKAIADWGEGKRNDAQKMAAKNAIQFTLEMLRSGF